MLDHIPKLGVAVAVPHGEAMPKNDFGLKDRRYDPLVGVTLHALDVFRTQIAPVSAHTALIALTDGGCQSHLARVFDGVRAQRPRQAFFTRASNTMLASYPAMAAQSHGPCFALTGGVDALGLAFASARALLEAQHCDSVLLIAADDDDTQHRASIIPVTDRTHRLFDATDFPAGLAPVDLLNLVLLDTKEPVLS